MTGDKFTIRTSTGQLFGSFDSREEAWAVVERIRRSDHHESVHAAAVVPLLAGVEPKPLHQGWLSDASEGAQGDNAASLTQRELDAAVDTFVGAYNSSRSAHLHHHYASAYIVASDQHLRAAVSAVLAPVLAEVDRLAGHSKTLNAVTWEIAIALGAVPPGVTWFEGNPVVLVERLTGTLWRRTAQLDAIDEEIRAFGIEHPLGRAGVADVCAMAAGRLVELEQVRAERDAARADADAARARIAELGQLL